MTRRTRNSSCIYTGKVGARMSVRVKRPSRRIFLVSVVLQAGPLHGETVRLDADSGPFTLPLAPMKGHPAGHYAGSRWVPHLSQPGTTP